MVRAFGRFGLWLIALGALITTAAMHGPHVFAVLQPAGEIGSKERRLMAYAILLGVIVVVPVFVMLFGFAWRYREGGSGKAAYTPEVGGNRVAETIWWLIPLAIISILSVLTWNSSHQLDPFKPLASSQPALPVQVVALDWKWLFLYPEQHVATINELIIPTNRPISFSITSDAPMNSFWIPQLGGQVYAMSGMDTQLQLIANKAGSYYGSSANISGNGFAGMHFMTKAMAPSSFAAWVQQTQAGHQSLTTAAYIALAKPSTNNPSTTFAHFDSRLFSNVIEQYMMPGMSMSQMASTEGAH